MITHPERVVICIMIAFLVNSGLACLGYRRVLVQKPADVPKALAAWAAGLLSSVLMFISILGRSMLNELSMSIGVMVLMAGLVIGIQLCLTSRSQEPPDDNDPASEPVAPPTLRAVPPIEPLGPTESGIVDRLLDSLHEDAHV